MVFNSFSFIFLFFPILIIIYRIAQRRWCPAVLCTGSLVFYGYGVQDAPWQLALLAGMTGLGMLGCRLFSRPSLRRRGLLALMVALMVAPLAYVKLTTLLLDADTALPLGLSFYTFQLVAFLACAYKGGATTPVGVLTGTLMFPKLISGPLAEPEALLPAIEKPERKHSLLDQGLEMFIIGLAFKVIVADHLSGVLGQIRTWGVEAVTVPMAWLGMVSYALQLYLDFWGYSLMAMGLGLMLGIPLPENFRHPYCAGSISEFWRRWHITLGRWFRDHVYIPLGGSRRGRLRMVLSTLTVWLLTGLWHGSGWNYILWGAVMFLLIMGERLVYGKALDRLPWLGHIYVPMVVALSWIFFFTPTPADAAAYFLRLAGRGGIVGDPGDWLNALGWCWPYLVLGVALCTPLPERLWKRVSGSVPAWVLLFALFWVCMYFLATAASDPFLYFSF